MKKSIYVASLFLCATTLFTGCSKDFKALPEIKANETIINDGLCEVKLVSAGFYDDIVTTSEKLNSGTDGMKKLAYKISVKNISEKPINVADIVKIDTKYGDKYSFDATKIFHFSNNGNITPLEQTTGYVYIDIPSEVSSSPEQMENRLSIGRNEYAFKQSIEDYDTYFKNMNAIYEKYDAKITSNNKQMSQIGEKIKDVVSEINFINPFDSDAEEQINRYKSKIDELQKQLDACSQKTLQYHKDESSEWNSIVPPKELINAHHALIKHIDTVTSMTTESFNSDTSKTSEIAIKYRPILKESYEIFKEPLYQIKYTQEINAPKTTS